MVSPVPFIGRIPADADTIQRKYACVCHTVFLVTIRLNQHSLTDFDSENVPTCTKVTDNSPDSIY